MNRLIVRCCIFVWSAENVWKNEKILSKCIFGSYLMFCWSISIFEWWIFTRGVWVCVPVFAGLKNYPHFFWCDFGLLNTERETHNIKKTNKLETTARIVYDSMSYGKVERRQQKKPTNCFFFVYLCVFILANSCIIRYSYLIDHSVVCTHTNLHIYLSPSVI